MLANLTSVGRWLHKRAENLLALMLLAMFVVFILQIAFRYLLNLPIGWTHEISVILWIWIVLFGSAFVVSDNEEIRFDIIYSKSPWKTRRVFMIITAVFTAGIFLVALPATWDYILFMRVQRTAYLKIPFDFIYSAFGLFMIATIIRQIYVGYQAIWGKEVEVDITQKSAGV